MGAATVELDRHDQQGIGGRVTSAWRAIGRPARVLTVLAALGCVVLAALWAGESLAVVACGLSLLVLVVAALVDAVEHRLPDVLVLAASLPVVAALVLAGSPDLARSAAVGSVVVAGPLLVTHLVTPSGMGFGDVKAGAVLGAALGLIDVEVALLGLVLGLGLGAVWGVGRRVRSIALGPALVLGALAAVVIARLVGVEAVVCERADEEGIPTMTVTDDEHDAAPEVGAAPERGRARRPRTDPAAALRARQGRRAAPPQPDVDRRGCPARAA